ncbi:hypothetical protein GLOIN_2v1790940 [Rhizophagus irregularis DAOM 181602=DAOM 197198]|nr:hypothetical protein GLOIN_2v1790940 [Rhizophagus irregularis DAOM 181602=DAOM 197198]
MLRNKSRKANIAAIPFVSVIILEVAKSIMNMADGDDDLEQRSDDDHIEQRSDNEQRNDNDDDLEQRSNNEEVMKIMKQCRQIMKKDMILISQKKSYSLMKHWLKISYHLFGDFAPYFQNLTTAALFCWIYKHNISTNAYEDLVDIIMRPEFNRDHIVKNIRRFRSWRERLPLPSISAKSISISSKKTPSTLKDSKMAYQLSISDIIWNVLNNPSLLKEMYLVLVSIQKQIRVLAWYLMGRVTSFRSRTINDIRDIPMRRFCYYYDNERKLGRLRAILLNEENQQYRLRIQKVLDYSDLPGNFKGELRQNRSLSGEVWLQDEPFLTINITNFRKGCCRYTTNYRNTL